MADDPSLASISAEDKSKLETRDFLRFCLSLSQLEAELLEDIADACEINDYTALTLASGDLTVATAADRLFLTEDEAALLIKVCKAEVGKVAAGAAVPSGPAAAAPSAPAPAPVAAKAPAPAADSKPASSNYGAAAPTKPAAAPSKPALVAAASVKAAIPTPPKEAAVVGASSVFTAPAVHVQAAANGLQPSKTESAAPQTAPENHAADVNLEEVAPVLAAAEVPPAVSSHGFEENGAMEEEHGAEEQNVPEEDVPATAAAAATAGLATPPPAASAPQAQPLHRATSIPSAPTSTSKSGKLDSAPSKLSRLPSAEPITPAFAGKTSLSLSKSVSLTERPAADKSTARKEDRRTSNTSDAGNYTTPSSARARPQSAVPQSTSSTKATPPVRPLSAVPLSKSASKGALRLPESPRSNGSGHTSSGYVPSYMRSTEAHKARVAKVEEPVDEKKGKNGLAVPISGFISKTLLKPTQSFMAWTNGKKEDKVDKPEKLSKSTTLAKSNSSKSMSNISPAALNSDGKPRITKPQPFNLATEKRTPKEKLPTSEELAMQKAREEKFKARPAPNFSKSVDNLSIIQENKASPAVDRPFQLASAERHQRAQEELNKKVRAEA